MPYILLILGLLIGLYTLYRFFLNANIAQIKALFLSAALFTICLALLYLALTGKLVAALALLIPLAPILLEVYKAWKGGQKSAPSESIQTRKDALEILDLDETADDKAIETAYKRLMKKVHPDAEGSEWMAAKLNQARDMLINKKHDNS